MFTHVIYSVAKVNRGGEETSFLFFLLLLLLCFVSKKNLLVGCTLPVNFTDVAATDGTGNKEQFLPAGAVLRVSV